MVTVIVAWGLFGLLCLFCHFYDFHLVDEIDQRMRLSLVVLQLLLACAWFVDAHGVKIVFLVDSFD